MDTPSKFVKFLKDKFSRTKGTIPPELRLNKIEEMQKWSDSKESVLVKKTEFDSLQMELFNQTEIIKRLKKRDEESFSMIKDYETVFKTLGKSSISLEGENYIVELEKVKSNEERLKSHIQALKRDLIHREEKAENEISYKDQIIDNQKVEEERLQNIIKKQNLTIQELTFANSEMKLKLEKNYEIMIELTSICKELLQE
ncbi:hypothetical protein GINT2_000965 [Glugoides intestinalis]